MEEKTQGVKIVLENKEIENILNNSMLKPEELEIVMKSYYKLENLVEHLRDEVYEFESDIDDLEDQVKDLEKEIDELESDLEDIEDKFPVKTMYDESKLELMQEIWNLYSLEDLQKMFSFEPGKILKKKICLYQNIENKNDDLQSTIYELEHQLFDANDRLEELSNE